MVRVVGIRIHPAEINQPHKPLKLDEACIPLSPDLRVVESSAGKKQKIIEGLVLVANIHAIKTVRRRMEFHGFPFQGGSSDAAGM